MLNSEQLDHLRNLRSLPPEVKCACGWDLKGKCYWCDGEGREIARGEKGRLPPEEPARVRPEQPTA